MKRTLLTALVLAASLGFTAPCPAADEKPAPKLDNTRENKLNTEVSADQQSETQADIKITQKIRQAIMKDKSLSEYAHNVKIITRNGTVTLKGPVRSEKEKSAVQKIAAKIAGKKMVTNELDIAPKQ